MIFHRDPKRQHPFFRVSQRGRAAYLILCFEEALKLYCKEDLDRWEWLLNELWEITTTDSFDLWVGRIAHASAEEIMQYSSYQELVQKYQENNKRSGVHIVYELSEKEFCKMHRLYEDYGTKPFFPVLIKLYEQILDVIAWEWGDQIHPHTPDSLEVIDQAERILRENGVPLPQNKEAMSFVMAHTDKYEGTPFDGRPFSVLSGPSVPPAI